MMSPVPTNVRMRIGITAAAFTAVVAAGCAAPASNAPAAHNTPSSATQPTSRTPQQKKIATVREHASARPSAANEAACGSRPAASGDIYVYMVTPGSNPVAQRLGGEWIWNVTLHKCLTSVQMMIATAPSGAGFCTEVGYVADNPGYNPNATPARPLSKVAASAPTGC